jgi:hypothetical protein
MSISRETKSQRVLSNVIAGAITVVIVVGAAIGTPVLVNASNAAHQEQMQQTADAKAATTLVRAAGQQDAVLTESATQAGVIAQQEAEAKAAAEAAAQAAAAQAAADAAAAAQAAQQQQQEAATSDDAADQGSGSDPAPAAQTHCPAGSQANSGDASGDTSCFPEICFHIVLPDPAHPECVTPFKP